MASLNVVAKLRVTNLSSLCGLTRFYTVFPPSYVKPVYKKNEQEALLETEEGRKIAFSPIKPAMSDDTSSEFHDEVTRKLTNYIMRKGDKKLARKLVDQTFENIKRHQLEKYNKADSSKKEEIELDPKVILSGAVKNCTPLLELRPMRKGGITYQVPVPMNVNRARFLSMNWLIKAAVDKESSVTFSSQLARELIDAFHNKGRVIKQKQDLHKQCDANRAYAHFRWT